MDNFNPHSISKILPLKKFNTSVSKHSFETTITADCAVFGFQDNRLKILLVKRSIEPFKGHWMLPGGIMDETQTLEESVNDVLYNLTSIRNIHYDQVKVYSALNRHPIKRVVTTCFYALIKPENHPVIAKNYVSDVKWFPIDDYPTLGFDHSKLVADALAELRKNVQHHLILGELLPEKFTFTELHDLFESILGESLDRRNFRKKMLQMNCLIATNEKKKGVKGGPELFKLKVRSS